MEYSKEQWTAAMQSEVAGRSVTAGLAPGLPFYSPASQPYYLSGREPHQFIGPTPQGVGREIVPHVAIGAGAAPLGILPRAPVPTLTERFPQAFNGISALPAGAEVPAGVLATPQAIPLIAGAGALLGKFMSLGAIKALLAKFGPTILKAVIGAGAFAAVMKLLGIGASDDTPVKIGVGRKSRRVSISVNSRPRTIHRAAKIAINTMKKHDKYFRLLQPRVRTKYVAAGSQYLSPVEKKALKA